MNDQKLTQTLAKVADGDYSEDFQEEWTEHVHALGQIEPVLTSEEKQELHSAIETFEQLIDSGADRIERAAVQRDDQE